MDYNNGYSNGMADDGDDNDTDADDNDNIKTKISN